MAPNITEYISSIDGRVGHEFPVEDDLMARAGLEEDWEETEKRQLEILAFARDFRRVFPNEAFSGIFQTDRNSGNKVKVKTEDQVLAEAYDWLKKKTKGDTAQALKILKETGLVDQYANPIIEMFRNADETAVKAEEEKEADKDLEGSPRQPGKALEEFRHGDKSQNRASEVLTDDNQARRDRNEAVSKKREEYKAGTNPLERKKVVGSYGVILNEQEAQLWKKGELVSKISTEDVGGFAALADEIDLAKTAEDVETLFDSISDAATDLPLPKPIHPQVGSRVAFRMGNASASGSLQSVTGDICTVLCDGKIAGMEGVEIEVPLRNVSAMSSQCCTASAKAGSKFCGECGSKVAA